ncbi:YdcF family protein [Cytobacillus purgationiresistens]|uniref:Uncharacterized SAM-binding protein YcdF (DUF218 family) n=1 Tax=Cytobacillus purgationiresistens TaxID=863449 RepID=A0ABU0AHX7_9BACI|nr:YdcF family protein [Cytobacillus purgationiresistens]MDQ0270499.1 uncharacterized SAM-binding protein YcdF (DUF218 family) [Cytobacillus purgationiresistens]
MKKRLLLIALCIPIIAIIIIAFLHFKIQSVAKQSPPADSPYLIVLGAKVNGEDMSLSLLYRAQAALEYLKQNQDTIVIATGGQGEGEDISEAESLRRFFSENGISDDRIWLEDQSTSTYENLAFTKEQFEIEHAVIVSSDFHLYRASILADKVGIEANTLAADTPAVVKVQLYVREYAALLKTLILGR